MHGQARGWIDSMLDRSAPNATALTFDEAFTIHHRAVFATARSVLHDSALAEDVTQEVFLKLHQNMARTQQPELLRPWLLRVTLNVARNAVRTRNRAISRDTTYYRDASDSQPISSPDQKYEIQLDVVEARRALNKIEEPMRSCLLLKCQGLSYREIAKTLSLDETYVGSLIARGRKKFVRSYKKIGVVK